LLNHSRLLVAYQTLKQIKRRKINSLLIEDLATRVTRQRKKKEKSVLFVAKSNGKKLIKGKHLVVCRIDENATSIFLFYK
jgi:hypothetical protein